MKNKFKLKNEEAKTEKDIEVKGALTEDELNQIEKKQKRLKHTRTILIFLGITLLALFIGIWWQGFKFDLIAFADAFTLSFVFSLLITWIMFMYNKNILSPMIHGIKTFGLMLVGKRPKKDYYTYMKGIEEDPIPSYIIIYSLIYTLISMVAMIFFIILTYAL